ncbi:MAG: hypothetical protein MSH58_12935, partial [Clostridiales bacterium]|nr:hypothetical protein [Clostridiales bacterium]
ATPLAEFSVTDGSEIHSYFCTRWLKYSLALVAQILASTWLKYSLTFTTWEPTNQPSYTRAHITIRFHNKAGYEMLISPEDFYIGNERVTCVQSDGTPRLLSGKSGNYSFHIKYDSDEPLSSLEELYQLNGRFEVFRYEGDTLYDGYYFPFSVSEAFS